MGVCRITSWAADDARERKQMNPDAGTSDFFSQAKAESERLWQAIPLHPGIYGPQVQAGTRWLPGLGEAQISTFEQAMGFSFPQIYRDYLRVMNGTDQPKVNIYGSSGTASAYEPGYYSFPRDLVAIRQRITWIYDACDIDEGYVVANRIPHIMPIVGHRFLVMDNSLQHPVLSMYGHDIIPYARDLKRFLLHDIPRSNNPWDDGTGVLEASHVSVPYWETYWRVAPDELSSRADG